MERVSVGKALIGVVSGVVLSALTLYVLVVAGGALISHLVQGLLALGALSFTMIASKGSSFLPKNQLLLLLILVYVGVLLTLAVVTYRIDDPARVFAFLFRFKRFGFLRPKIFDFHNGLSLILKGDRWRLVRIVCYTLLYLVCTYAVIPVILVGLGAPQPIGNVVAFQLTLFFAASLAPTPGSSGAIELGAYSLFSLIVPSFAIGSFLIWWRIASFYCHLVVGSIPFAYLALSNNWYRQPTNRE